MTDLILEARLAGTDADVRIFPVLGVGVPGRCISRKAVEYWWLLAHLPEDLSGLTYDDLLSASGAVWRVQNEWTWAGLPHDGADVVSERVWAEIVLRRQMRAAA